MARVDSEFQTGPGTPHSVPAGSSPPLRTRGRRSSCPAPSATTYPSPAWPPFPSGLASSRRPAVSTIGMWTFTWTRTGSAPTTVCGWTTCRPRPGWWRGPGSIGTPSRGRETSTPAAPPSPTSLWPIRTPSSTRSVPWTGVPYGSTWATRRRPTWVSTGTWPESASPTRTWTTSRGASKPLPSHRWRRSRRWASPASRFSGWALVSRLGLGG